MPPKRKSKAEILAQQRLYKRRRYAEIKNDPELLAVAKEKRRIKYLKDKEAKKIKSISEQTPRSQREQRKKWKQNSARYRQNKKQKKLPSFEAVEVTAGPSDQGESIPTRDLTEDPLRLLNQNVVTAVRKIRYIELLKRKKLLTIIAAYRKRDRTLCKQIERLRKLLKEQQGIQGDAKNEVLEDISSETTFQSAKCNIVSHSSLSERIKDFFLDDANSVVCAGKKEFITRNKVRMQKRYLCLPLKDLYRKFRIETNTKISYSFFCKLRPFWVVLRKKNDRDTCLCSIHLNMELLIEGLNKAYLIIEKNSEEVLSKMCCLNRNLDCLQRNCDTCKSNEIEFKQISRNVCSFYEWKKTTREITLTNGNKKKQAITEKIKVTVTATEAMDKFKTEITKFFDHTYRILSQYKTIKNLKENLNIQEAVVHVDFSENYALKYGAEVQSFHFGASRQQVSLHTAVIYTHNFSTGQVAATSMCTMSNCLRHDAPAVWSHLIPLIEELIKINPFIDTLHFLSDSPSSQYRNKYIFYMITQLEKDFSQIRRVTWNYSEVGHGKGAPDGVGATLKRTADRMVTYGQDVGTFDDFYKLITKQIQEKDLKVIVKKVEEKDIESKAKVIPNNLKSFKGTFSVYQVLWDKFQPNTYFRTLSCFDCAPSIFCEHGKHLACIPNTIYSPQITDNKKITILSDITLNKINIPLLQKNLKQPPDVTILAKTKIRNNETENRTIVSDNVTLYNIKKPSTSN